MVLFMDVALSLPSTSDIIDIHKTGCNYEVLDVGQGIPVLYVPGDMGRLELGEGVYGMGLDTVRARKP